MPPFAISNVDLQQKLRIDKNTEYLTGLSNSYVGPLKLVVITHSFDPPDPIFWTPFIENIKSAASNYDQQITGITDKKEPSIYPVGNLSSAEKQILTQEILDAKPDIIALTGVPSIIDDMYNFGIRDSDISHFFFNVEPPNVPSSTTNYFGYVGQYEANGATGKHLAKTLKAVYGKRYAIVLNTEPASVFPDGPLALRSSGIEHEFGSGTFQERSPATTFRFDSSDPAWTYFTDTSPPPAVNFANDVNTALGLGLTVSQIAVIGVTPAYINYMANWQSYTPKIDYSAFDTIPSSYGMPTDWQEIVFQNPHEQAKSIVEMAIEFSRNGTKQLRLTGPKLLGGLSAVPPADSENFEIKIY